MLFGGKSNSAALAVAFLFNKIVGHNDRDKHDKIVHDPIVRLLPHSGLYPLLALGRILGSSSSIAESHLDCIDGPYVAGAWVLRVEASHLAEAFREDHKSRTRRCTVNCRGAGCFRCLFLGHIFSVFGLVSRPRQCRELNRSAKEPRLLP